jgi:gluconolactonase
MLSNGRIFASGIVSASEPGVPDGMKCDLFGNVWVCGPGGVWVYAPDGRLIGKLRLPELVGNLTWGGPDFRTLFLTATHSVYAVETKVGPRTEPYMRQGTSGRASAPPLLHRAGTTRFLRAPSAAGAAPRLASCSSRKSLPASDQRARPLGLRGCRPPRNPRPRG